MFRSKKDIDRHVSDIFSKIHNENERNLRGFNIARLYFQFKDYETAKKHLLNFQSVRDSHPPSHKLMAQIHEATGNIERSLYSYKRCLELDGNQRDVVLKICELYCQIPVDHETARYWADRADELFPHNEIVFQLRECLVSAEGEPNRQELENLIATELAAQPKNLNLRIKLLKLYLDSERVKEAYAHAVKVESKKPFPKSLDWYDCLVDIFEAYQEESDQELSADFYIHFLTAVDHLSALTLAEPHVLCSDNDKNSPMYSCSIDNAASILRTFDQLVKKVCDLPFKDSSWLYFLHHMKGQLYFRLGTLLMKRALKDQGNWKELCRVSAALFLIGYSFKPANLLQEVWFSRLDEKQKIFTGFFQNAALRISCIGHMVMSVCKEDKNVWLQKIKQSVCIVQVRERTYNRLFNSIGQSQNNKDSYFLQDAKFIESSLEFPSISALQDYDRIAYKMCPDSLHHLVWLHLHQEARDKIETSQTNLCEIFKGLHYGNSNLSKGSPESLCLLDIESFLYATVYTSSLSLDHRTATMGLHSEDIFLCVPPDIAGALCTSDQGAWWKAAYDLFTGAIREKLGDKRRILQRGLEVIRGIGNHGLDVELVVYLARLFADRAASNVMSSGRGKEINENKFQSDKTCQLEVRAMHYWNIALAMLEKLEQNLTIRVPKERMFASYGKSLSSDEVTTLREEGQLYLACREMNSGRLEEAAAILSKLQSPFASFYLALTLKKSALQQIEIKSSNGIDATEWNTRTALLNRAKDSLYTTMDRIKGNENHPLNKELMVEIVDIENEIVKDLENARVNGSGSSEEEECDYVDNSPLSPQNSNSIPKPPRRFTNQSTPRPAPEFLTPVSKHKNINETKTKRLQPSPERLDVQIRTLTLTQDTLVKTMLEQQKALTETNKTMLEQQRALTETNKCMVEELKQNKEVIEELKKQLEELSKSTNKYFARSSIKKSTVLKSQDDDEDEEDYGDYDANGCMLDYYIDDNGEVDYRRAGYPYVQPPVVPEPSVAPAMGYIHQPPLPPTGPPPPPQLSYGFQYPPPPLPPAGPAIPESPQYYHTAPTQGLSFSEGQRLPQFHFHMGSPMLKAPVPNVLVPPPHPPPSIIATPSGQQAVKTPTMQPHSPWVKGTTVPHAFQIPLPPSVSTASTPTQPPAILSSPTPYVTPSPAAQKSLPPPPAQSKETPPAQGVLKTLLSTPPAVSAADVPSVTYATVSPALNTSTASSKGSSILNKSADSLNLGRIRQNSDVGSETEGHDIEKEVMSDYKPLIPLPAEIVVETGEEGEKVLFEERAKLFRYVDHEWKERGVGIMKLLHNENSGKVRVLMRRDQVLKVCANHFILPSMEIHPMKNSDRAWIWAAKDFADETIKPEQFCIKFKTSDIGVSFKKAFDRSVAIVTQMEGKTTPAVPKTPPASNSFSSKFLPKAGSWNCPMCYVNNASEKLSCSACEAQKPFSQQSAEKSPFTIIKLPSFPFATASNANTAPAQSAIISTSEVQSTSKIHDSIEGSTKTKETTPPALALHSQLATTDTNILLPAGTKATVGGFTFTSVPVIRESISPDNTDREILVVNTKAKNGPQVSKVTESSKVSPFSGFSFKPATSPSFSFNSPASIISKTIAQSPENKPASAETSKQAVFGASSDASKLQFSSLSSESPKFIKDGAFQGFNGAGSPLFVTVTKEGRRVSGEFSGEGTPEEFEPTTEFKPVVPLPALVEVKTGEEEEEKLFGVRSKLYRYDEDSKEWKERGIGELKILFQQSMGKYRILMRREQVLKLCANHYIFPEMKLTPLSTSDRAWVWCAKDFSEGYLREEKFAAKFKNSDIAKQFYSVFENCKQNLPTASEDDSESISNALNRAETSETDEQKSLSAMFKPQLGSWECSCCYVRNESSRIKCVACDFTKPGCENATVAKPAVSSTKEFSTNCSDLKKSFADLFKPDVNSWECQSCLVRNDKSKSKCAACETPKAGSSTVVASSHSTAPVKSNIFGGFSFGSQTPANSSAGSSTVVAPSPSTPVTSNIFGGFGSQNPANSSDSQKFVFGKSPSSTAKSGFVFGLNSSTFTFGQTALSSCPGENMGFKPTLNTDNTSKSAAVFGGTTISPSPVSEAKVTTPSSSIFTMPTATIPPAYVFGNTPTVPKFTFGAPLTANDEEEPTTPTDSSVEFRFGSPQKYEFNFSGVRPRSPTKTPKSPKTPGTPTDVEDEEDVESSDDIYFQPVIPLPPKIDVKTGEENETVLFSKRAKLFRFSNGEWKERGIGDIKVLLNPQNETFRLLMRREQVLKVCLNHYLTSGIKFEPKSDKALSWAATDFSENEPSPELFTVRFKTAEILTEFEDVIDSIMKQLNSCSQNEVKPSGSSKVLINPMSVLSQKLSNKPDNTPVDKHKPASSFSPSSNSSPPANASSFSFRVEEKKQTPTNSTFSLSSRFGASQTPVKMLFGSSLDSTKVFPKSTFNFSMPESGEKDVEVLESKTASVQQREQAEKLKLPSNFYLYENKTPCPGCRGCDTGHVEDCGKDDEVQVLYETAPTPEQIAAARELLLPLTFFLYENKPPCLGCRGCIDDIPQHAGEKNIEDDEQKTLVETEVIQSQVTQPDNIENAESDSQAMFINTAVSTFSFAELAAKGSGFEALASKTSPNRIAFSGAGAPVFGSLNDSKASEGNGDDVALVPDIHFEPIIPLPELVEVKTGEEDEISVFSHRAKLYKYDEIIHQWKERGIGDFKILKHHEKCRYRLLLRREQVHKVACNHCIHPDMKLAPLSTSEIALCWNAIDYSENFAESSKFAVKFKNKEIMEQFKSKFDECLKTLTQNQENTCGDFQGNHIVPRPVSDSAFPKSQSSDAIPVQSNQCQDEKDRTKVTEVVTVSTNQEKVSPTGVAISSQSDPCSKESVQTTGMAPMYKVEEEQNYVGEHDEDTEDDDDNDIMFEKRVQFEIYDDDKGDFKVAGLGLLRMLYDDSVFGYRITMTDDQNIVLCDHIIAIQTSLRQGKKNATWAAIDMSIDPPKRRQFRAKFSSQEALNEFQTMFNEGKQAAIQSCIVENTDFPPHR